MSVRPSAKAQRFTESVIREMTRLAQLHGAVNLSQGFPDFPAPEEVKEAARRAIAADVNQYAITWGARSLRQAIARKFERLYGLPVDPETEVTVTCGSTDAMIAALLAVLDPGDEVVVFEPFYENYGPDAILRRGAAPVSLRPPGGRSIPRAGARSEPHPGRHREQPQQPRRARVPRAGAGRSPRCA
jgi:aminotransferase